MKFFEWFWRSKVFVYALVSVAGLTSIYLFFVRGRIRVRVVFF